MRGGWVYIMTNAPYGTLYIGVTADLPARVSQHREGSGSTFCKRHGLTRLVHCELFERIEDAIAREKAMKAWKRKWKIEQIEQGNPHWDDLFEHIIQASFEKHSLPVVIPADAGSHTGSTWTPAFAGVTG